MSSLPLVSDVDGILNYLNSLRPTIKFTMELEEGGSLPFLDTRLSRLTNGKLDITVYCKKTYTDRYLQRDESLKEEKSHLKKTFVGKGYPRAFIHLAIVPRPLREPIADNDHDETNVEKPPVGA